MKIIDRYIMKEFSLLLVMIMSLFVTLFIIIDFFERLKLFLSNHASIRQMVSFIFYQIPMIVSLTLPAAVLIATLITLSTFLQKQRNHRHEGQRDQLISHRLTDFSVRHGDQFFPFFFSEWITPMANQKADHIKYVEIKKQEGTGQF